MAMRALLVVAVLTSHYTLSLLVANNFVKTVQKGGAIIDLFGKKRNVNVLDNVTVTIRSGITAFVGPSGAGKSTLAKCIIGKESLSSGTVTGGGEDTSSCDGYLISSSDMQKRSCYVDHLFSSSYNDKLCLEELVPSIAQGALLQEAAEVLDIPKHDPVCGMLVSKKKCFEIFLAMSRLESLSSSATDLSRVVLVLDEYLDKEVPSVRRNICKGLRALCAHPSIRLHVILITHSKGVLDDCSDNVVCLKGGRIYHQGKYNKAISYPAQLEFIE